MQNKLHRMLKRYYLEKSVCNDGSRSVFYFYKSQSDQISSSFVIRLPGGGQCYDEQTCKKRMSKGGGRYMSSLSYGEFLNGTGILDSSSLKSPLWFANKVYIAYCSSDAFMGNINENETVWGWYFQGQQIVYETIRILRDKFGLDHNSKVVLSGSSAGARGLMVLYENLVENHLPKGIDVFAFLDSPYYIDVVPYTSSFRGFLYETSQVYVNYNVSLDILGVDCKAHFSKEPWKCLFGQYRICLLYTSPSPRD